MCNMSQGYFDDGVQVGEEKGMEKAIRNAMRNGNLSFEQAAALLGIPVQKYDTYKKLLGLPQ